MSSDCTVKIDDGILNIRVGAIIMKDNKILMVGNDKDKFLYSQHSLNFQIYLKLQ